jgi:mRNA interferase HigB
MRIISRRTLRQFWEKHSTAKPGLSLWYYRVSDAQFDSFQALREVFPAADSVGNFTIFNISGNNYRLVTYFNYQAQIVFIRAILTHQEYDKENWKNDNWF